MVSNKSFDSAISHKQEFLKTKNFSRAKIFHKQELLLRLTPSFDVIFLIHQQTRLHFFFRKSTRCNLSNYSNSTSKVKVSKSAFMPASCVSLANLFYQILPWCRNGSVQNRK